jgi:hypothetical protein
MATSRRHTRIAGAALAGLVASATVALALASGGEPHHAPAAHRTTLSPRAVLSGLGPARAPISWPAATIASGAATLRHPRGWSAITGDAGTVSFALRDGGGRYLGYLNLTPREGAEHLSGWPAFRVARNRDEGDTRVVVRAVRAEVPFQNATGSCVIDDYSSRVGANPYRELACLVRGRHSESVLVAAALRPDWERLSAELTRSAAALLVR